MGAIPAHDPDGIATSALLKALIEQLVRANKLLPGDVNQLVDDALHRVREQKEKVEERNRGQRYLSDIGLPEALEEAEHIIGELHRPPIPRRSRDA